jgi:hypothetical protein
MIFSNGTYKGKCLPTGSLPIREYNSVVSVHCSTDMATCHRVIYGLVV